MITRDVLFFLSILNLIVGKIINNVNVKRVNVVWTLVLFYIMLFMFIYMYIAHDVMNKYLFKYWNSIIQGVFIVQLISEVFTSNIIHLLLPRHVLLLAPRPRYYTICARGLWFYTYIVNRILISQVSCPWIQTHNIEIQYTLCHTTMYKKHT